ncbi:BLUF domain-containing protein [Mucilaginibacter sp. PAMB04274]|uniref:BLUF domain-containing protein n=1 Tax=Mucilaginibacter sp. PAMB04274 TaxID=3138568 RepID=UPI0031F675D0
MIFSIIYVSKALHPMKNEDLTDLLEQSRSWNESFGITGMLLYIDGQEPGRKPGRFMQVIEGTQSDIMLLFNKIKEDRRHHQITVLHEGRTGRRHFKQWSMGFKTISDNALGREGFIDFEDAFLKNKRQPKFNMAFNYLKSFYEMKL